MQEPWASGISCLNRLLGAEHDHLSVCGHLCQGVCKSSKVGDTGAENLVAPALAEADFAPAARLARNLGEDRFIGLEYYSDFGKIGNVLPLQQQYQELYAVTDFKVKEVDVELGVGYGFTTGSDRLMLKAIIGYAFPVPGKGNDSGSTPNTPLAMGTSARPSQSALITK